MSCLIKGIAHLVDPQDVKEKLLAGEDVKLDHVPKDELPLQDTLISLSSTGDIMAMAINTNIVVLASKWDSQETGEVKNKFYTIWNESLGIKENEWITSLACLPLISLAKAGAVNSPDWTCIVVGFNTGFLRFYTETGALLIEEQLENEPILGIKCQSHSPPRHVGQPGISEEIHILYKSVVCVLPGFALFSTLRACRNHLARVQANCNDKRPASNLAYKKWGFKDQDIVNDCQVIGTTAVNTFDHLMTASICGGYNASYRSSPPQHNLIMAVGKRPFIGFHYALEGGAAPVLSDVALAMANTLANAIGKIGTAVPWFRSSSKQSSISEKSKGPEKEPAESMTCRFGLSDVMREGDCLVISPNKALSVVNDAMGRVILVDNKRGIALRMWKGYRDAQCGWIEVSEDHHRTASGHKVHAKNHLRTALFLAIYAPKKGIIDIWSIQQGAKITTFSASKNGRLLYTNYGLLGLNDVALSSENRAQYGCVFIDPIGGLKEILVPFHFALSSKNGKRARDIHLLKKLKTFIREEDFDDEKLIDQVTEVCTEIKTNEIRLQILEMLMHSKHVIPEALQVAATYFLGALSKYDEAEFEPVVKTLHQMATHLDRAITFYKYTRSQFDRPPEYNTVASEIIPDAKHLSRLLSTSESEIERVLKLSKTLSEFESTKPKTNRVTFKDDGSMFLEFLSCFDFGIQNSLSLQKLVNDEKKYQISSLIYQGWMYSSDSTIQWKKAAEASKIRSRTMMHLALTYWLNKRPGAPLEIEIKRFTHLLHAICELANGEEQICVEYNEISSWWSDVRFTLAESNKPFQALTAALACRAVATNFQRSKDSMGKKVTDDNGNERDEDLVNNANVSDKTPNPPVPEGNSSPEDEMFSSASEWENMSRDACQFTELIASLEDITILNAVLSQPPLSDETTQFYALPFEKMDISLAAILGKGRGSVSETVAKWLSAAAVDPARLIDTRDVEFDQMQNSVDSLQATGTLDEAAAVDIPKDEELNLLKVSVEIGSEANTDTTAQTHILERISMLKRHFPYSLTSSVLLANLCWEFVMAWSRDVTNLEALEAALAVLRQIPMKPMRQGVCCLLWTLHVKRRMQAAAKLMNKLGKLPKERLCMQDTGLSDIQLTVMLQHCVTFLDIFLDAEIMEEERNCTVKFEEIWESHDVGPQAFATLAISQTPAWYELILLHLQLANVLHMMAHFNIKLMKPMNNLFETVTSRHFFQDITDKVILTWYHDDRRDNMRIEFLCRVITASMESIHQETNEGNALSSREAIHWMSKCQTLASIWKINNDKLRMHQVCQLYINGFDRLAEEVVTAVNDTESLGADLLPIAGRRMMDYLSKTPNLLEEVSRISPNLTQYLESLNLTGMVMTGSSNEDTVQLINRISRYLPETHSHYHFAQQMLDATFIYAGKT
ncbi:rab3 GTPase-activating protein non-catalytic subunit isoform X2 [Venturia canescens]|uniref:rab3 GTPase-activating protein non-catalytic subunit isoform X2 n=1 Tax=Venturia canescens TaxID=32260 RepID=UPI001C9CF02F|nr:rab3 GTPase-activating protein non-catalytic subunit isoform X2 [Venturia canescens]XP_043278055.1 rab3 GTPase-activating protein non-catalytic subunit isoform X2 [Venturia canescens]